MAAIGAMPGGRARTASRSSANWRSTARSPPSPGVLPAAIAANGRRHGLICPACLRRRGRLGERRHRNPGAALADPARQPLQGHAGAGPAGAGHRAGRRRPAGPARHQGPGERQADARDRRRRRPQSPDERPARGGQVHAGAAPALDPAAAGAARAARSLDDPVGRGPARRGRPVEPAAVPRAASFRLHGGPRRRRHQCPARARCRSPITACCSSTSCRNSSRRCSIRLRQPLETGEVLIARANHRVTYPARFQLVAAMNPCRCGQATEPGFVCRRQPNERCIAQYQARLSGPLLDRIDLSIEVPAVTAADLILPPPAEGSAEVAARVAAARERQARRYAALEARRRRHQRRLPAAAARRGRAARRRRACADCATPRTRCACRRAVSTGS